MFDSSFNGPAAVRAAEVKHNATGHAERQGVIWRRISRRTDRAQGSSFVERNVGGSRREPTARTARTGPPWMPFRRGSKRLSDLPTHLGDVIEVQSRLIPPTAPYLCAWEFFEELQLG